MYRTGSLEAFDYSQAVLAFSVIGIRSEPENSRVMSRPECVQNVGLTAKDVNCVVKFDQMRRFASS